MNRKKLKLKKFSAISYPALKIKVFIKIVLTKDNGKLKMPYIL